MESTFSKWLLDQAVTVVFMGLAIYFLWKEYKEEKKRHAKAEAESKERESKMASEIVQVTLLYDEHIKLTTKGYEKNTKEHERILEEIKKIKK